MGPARKNPDGKSWLNFHFINKNGELAMNLEVSESRIDLSCNDKHHAKRIIQYIVAKLVREGLSWSSSASLKGGYESCKASCTWSVRFSPFIKPLL